MNTTRHLLDKTDCPVSNEMIFFNLTDEFAMTPDGLRYLGIMDAVEPKTVTI